MTDKSFGNNADFLNRNEEREILQYSIATLMYTPALNGNIADDIYNKRFVGLKALALCLEDAIGDEGISIAEEQLISSISKIDNLIKKLSVNIDDLPLFFVRVRSPLQMEMLYEKMGETSAILTGFILPKFDLSNAEAYTAAISKINAGSKSVVYIMPIIESSSIINIETRIETLLKIKNIIDGVKKYVLNIRVGGNDFCNIYGLRRNCTQTIYDIAVVKDVLTDIINIFARDYVVSGPVWEYFGNGASDEWRKGLEKELALDKLNGFIGKTAIHPSQLPVILESMKVAENDYNDAKNIINWKDQTIGVSKSTSGNRMNELKAHINWAKKILILADIYGVKNNAN